MVVQKIGFFGMLHGIYGAIAAFASALQRGANAIDNLGKWAEEQTSVFVDEARIDREMKLEELEQRRAERKAKALVSPQSITDVTAKEAS
jgi:formylmethanofuran dehydrogenase subunit A